MNKLNNLNLNISQFNLQNTPKISQRYQSRLVRIDVLLLGLLIFVYLQNARFTQTIYPNILEDILSHPILGSILPVAGEEATGVMASSVESLAVMTNTILLVLFILYAFADVWGNPVDAVVNKRLENIALSKRFIERAKDLAVPAPFYVTLFGFGFADWWLNRQERHFEDKRYRRAKISLWFKWTLLWGILIVALFLPTTKFMLLHQASEAASYAHYEGVVQTEAAIQYFLDGKNPYNERYNYPPIDELAPSEDMTVTECYTTSYPDLPWTYLFSTPFYLVGQALGFYDQRIVYLLLIAIALVLVSSLLPKDQSQYRLILTALLGLNPLMIQDMWFGENTSFVLCWLIFALVVWKHGDRLKQAKRSSTMPWLIFSSVLFGLACASHPIAWFIAPFYGYLLIRTHHDRVPGTIWATCVGIIRDVPALIVRMLPAFAALMLILAPYLVWDGSALYNDVLSWHIGQGNTVSPNSGWGAGNFMLATGWNPNRLNVWSFWTIELLITILLLSWFVYRQKQKNTLSNACWYYSLLLLPIFYISPFFSENYLGYILYFFMIGYLSNEVNNHDEAHSLQEDLKALQEEVMRLKEERLSNINRSSMFSRQTESQKKSRSPFSQGRFSGKK
ncbi:MAG: hypothetical protein AAF639_46610 [Chloroflexota bacterium]